MKDTLDNTSDQNLKAAATGSEALGSASAVAYAGDYEVGTAESNATDEEKRAQPPRVFLLDDDPIFCKLMEKVAKRNGIPLAICSRLADFGRDRSHRDFDVAVIDYYLEDLKGPQIVWLLDDRPVVMVSRNEDCVAEDKEWPESIKKFVPKKQGPEAILEAALTLSRQS